MDLKEGITHFTDKAKYIFNYKLKTVFGLILVVLGSTGIVDLTFFTNSEGITAITNYLSLVLNILTLIIGMGLIILDESQRKNEDESSINVFIGKQLFEKGLYGIIVGVLISTLSIFLNAITKL